MSGENEQIEEEKKADGGKIKIPAHLIVAKQAPVAKPAWMQRLVSTKQLRGNKPHPAAEVTADNDAANKDNAELTDLPSSNRRRTYKVKKIITIVPISTSTETEIKETSDPSLPSPPETKDESTENEQTTIYRSQSQSQPSESRKSDILNKPTSLKEEAQSKSQPEREQAVLHSSDSSSQEVYEDKTDDGSGREDKTDEGSGTEDKTDDESGTEDKTDVGSGTEEEVILTDDDDDDDDSGEEMIVESSGSADTPVENSSPVGAAPTLPADGTTSQLPVAASNVATSTPLPRPPAATQKPPPSRMASVYAPGIGTPSRAAHEPAPAPVAPIPSPMVTVIPRRPSGAADDDDDDFDLVPKRPTPVPPDGTSGSIPNTLTLPRRPSLNQKAVTPLPSPRATRTEPQKAALDQGITDEVADGGRYNEDDDSTDEDDDVSDDWKFPHRHEDDSSWVNPSHPIQPERKQHVTEELKKKSVDLFPENGQVSQRLANLKSIDEEVNLNDYDYDTKVGFIIDPHGRGGGDGQTISETSFSEVSKMDSSAKIIETAVPKKDMDIWAMPSQEGTYRAIGKLDTHKDGKDYRFSYIAQPHTHSTASYADVVRERYFPQENNDYWAAPAREAPPELPIHISREGRIKSGPSDENESWMPPENDPNEPPVDRNKLYTPSLADERYSEARSVVSEGSDWIGRGAMSARVDFAGSVSDNNLDSFEWNPPKEPSLSTDQEQGIHCQQDDDSQQESESEDNDDELAIEATSATPRPPSPPAALQRKRASESAPQDKAAAAEANSKYDYSTSGRLKFDLTPKMIMIEGNPEKGKSKSTTGPGGSDPKDQGRFRCCMFLLLSVLVLLGGVACIVIFVVDPFNTNEETSPASPGNVPTMEPTSFDEGEDGPTKAPSPTATFFPGPAQNPSTPTSTIDEDELVEFLSAISSDNGEALKDSTSPQYAAMQWLLTSANIGVYKDSTLIQRYALASLYYATGGEQWLDSSSWLTDVSECEWYSSSDMGSICDVDENLLELNLRGNSLTGSLPPELNLLSNSLTTLHLGDNKISGQIPPELSDLWNLETLQLSQNQFRGTIPTLFGTMSSLRTLFLFQNSLRSAIPSQLGDLRTLKELDLGANRLTGGIPTELGALNNLISLSLYGNDLSGSIPSQLSGLTNLRVLYLDSNNLGPSLPESICRNLSLDEFWSDCDEIGGCECCTKCCQDGEPCA